MWPAERCITSVVPHFLDHFEPAWVWPAERCITSVVPHLLDLLGSGLLLSSERRVCLDIASPTCNPKIESCLLQFTFATTSKTIYDRHRKIRLIVTKCVIICPLLFCNHLHVAHISPQPHACQVCHRVISSLSPYPVLSLFCLIFVSPHLLDQLNLLACPQVNDVSALTSLPLLTLQF